jgi:two-component system, response regulator YesN
LKLPLNNLLYTSGIGDYEESPKTVVDIAKYMERHLTIHLTLAQASEMLNKSISRTCHLFLETFGKIFKEVQAETLITSAEKILVENPTMQVKEIAAQLSFKDPFYFSKFFKKKTGKNFSNFKKSLLCEEYASNVCSFHKG